MRGVVRRHFDAGVLAAGLLAGAAVRGIHLGGYQGLNGDEAFSFALAQRPFWHMLGLFRWEANGVLYPLVLWPLTRIGTGIEILRLPALLAGATAIPALYWTGKRLVGRTAALIGAAFLAISPVAVSYSQLARPYIFALLFGILSFGFLDRALDDRQSRRRWGLYVATTALAVYSSALAITLLLPHLVLVGSRRRFRAWLISLPVLLAALAPLATLLISERTRRNPLYWLDRPDVQTLRRAASQFMVDRYGLVIAVLLVLVASATFAVRRHEGELVGFAAVIAWAILPPVLLFVTSYLVSPVFWIGYALPALPGALLLLGTAAAQLPRPAAAVVILPLLLLSLRASALQSDWFHSVGWRSATAALTMHRRPGDPVLFDIPDGLGPAGYYSPAFRSETGRLVVSEWHDERIPPHLVLLDDPGGYGDVATGPPSRELIARLVRRTGRIFLMLYETNRQGPSNTWPAIVWARARCDVASRTFRDEITMYQLRNCRT